MIFMLDQYGRMINYMRVSVTDKCNLRCRYCMPEGVDRVPMSDLLTMEEIAAVCRQASLLGIDRIRITGGEPLVRKGVTELVEMLSALPEIKEVTLTTNGVLLGSFLPDLIRGGLKGINISLDTLDRDRYKKITGKDCMGKVLEAIQESVTAGLKVKINAVLMQDMNDQEWPDLIRLAKEQPVDVRFIEMMPIGAGALFDGVSNQILFNRIKDRYPDIEEDPDKHGNGPAVYYRLPGFQGSIGFISPIHGKFCAGCNRIRMTAMGDLKPCLCYETSTGIREILRSRGEEAVGQVLREIIYNKPKAHCFENREKITERNKMIAIGG